MASMMVMKVVLIYHENDNDHIDDYVNDDD